MALCKRPITIRRNDTATTRCNAAESRRTYRRVENAERDEDDVKRQTAHESGKLTVKLRKHSAMYTV